VGLFSSRTLISRNTSPQIVEAVSQALDRVVDFKNIDLIVSMNQGVQLHVTGLSIAENPQFGTDQFVNIQEIDARVDILAFVTSRAKSQYPTSVFVPLRLGLFAMQLVD
jgi:hypothetical protein